MGPGPDQHWGGAGRAVGGQQRPEVPPTEVERLLRPFQRLGADRTGHREGHGLGLSIVAAVAAAHHADLRVGARPDGGLQVVVHFRTPDEAAPPSAAIDGRAVRIGAAGDAAGNPPGG